MGDLVKFKNPDAERRKLQKQSDLKFLIQIVPESDFKSSFLLHLGGYEAPPNEIGSHRD
jgi:hypothetical protein